MASIEEHLHRERERAIEAETAARAAEADAISRRLTALISIYKKWLYLPDVAPLLAVLGTVAANLVPGDPLWLLIVGPPGGGKTELLQPIAALPSAIATSTLTEASLLSGTPAQQKAEDATGGLLREIGKVGILLCKDFGSILNMHRETRATVLAALREIYDGAWTRRLGIDGGRTLHWQGKLGFIGACTSSIDNHHAVMAAMGERFILYRLPINNENELAWRALSHQGQEVYMRRALAAAVGEFFSGLNLLEGGELKSAERARLIGLATLAARGRSAVERDGRTREVELIHDAEAPSRLVLALAKLLHGITAVGGSADEAWRVVTKVALDCIPALRFKLIRTLGGARDPVETETIARSVRHPTATTRRALEDLEAHGIVDRDRRSRSHFWLLSDWARTRCSAADINFPEMSDAQGGNDFPEMSGDMGSEETLF